MITKTDVYTMLFSIETIRLFSCFAGWIEIKSLRNDYGGTPTLPGEAGYAAQLEASFPYKL